MKKLKHLAEHPENFTILILAILFAAGFLFHNIAFTRPIVMGMTGIFLLVSNTLVYYFIWKNSGSLKLLLWSVAAFLLTFLIEFAGVKTGNIFGSYNYGVTMKLQLGNVPLVIAFNWVILIMATFNLSMKLIPNRWIAPIFSSVLIVVFDFIMEPVAMYLDYWQWMDDKVPLQNYIAWFFISLIFAFALSSLKLRPEVRILRYYFFIQLGFFLLFRLEMMLN